MADHEDAIRELLSDYPISLALPILWGDHDAFGHVNNTVQIRWFESGRIRYLEESGMHELMSAGGIGPILASVTCHYRKQLYYPDTVHIGTRITRIGRTSMTMEHAIVSTDQQVVAADGESIVVLFDFDSQRPQRMPADVRAAVERTEGRELG